MNVKAYSGQGSPEFVKHFSAVQFCVKNELSYPEETVEYFKGCFDGDDLDDINRNSIIGYVVHGRQIDLPITNINYGNEIHINVKDIPEGTETIIIKMK